MNEREATQDGNGLRPYALSLGAELYGVASAAAYEERFPDKPSPQNFIPGARSIVVIGMPFNRGTMATVVNPAASGLQDKAADSVTNKGGIAGVERYFSGEENAIIDNEIKTIAYKIARKLEMEGHTAMPMPPAKKDPRWLTPPFQHLPAAYLAGLGTMGLNCSLITPEHGPRVWLTSIITDRELSCGGPLAEEVCDECGECVENCPSGALDGKGWKNGFQCAAYGCCGSCIAICPVGGVH